MASAEMRRLFSIKGKSFYWAGKGFMFRGVWVWTGKRNVRIIPLNRIFKWTGEDPE